MKHNPLLSSPELRRAVLLALAAGVLMTAPALPMDQARATAGVDAAVARYGVTGRGVIVALLDRGIDWANADFRNEDGTTRIAYIFDLTDDSGAAAPGNTYGMGTIYTRQQINAALAGGATLATRDAVGHGTTTAGIAAGNGRNLPSRKYRGVAPEATIVVVKVTSDGAPAHDAEPAEAFFFREDRIPVAIDFVRDKARELRLPAVMLANFGTQGGPTDGTSLISRKIDATVGPGIPGLAFVTGAGDEGAQPNRAGGNVPSGGTVAIQIQKGTASPLVFDLWYPGADRFDVAIQTPSGPSGPYPAPSTGRDTQQTSNFTYHHNAGPPALFFGAQNGKREIYIQFTGPPGTYTVTLTGSTVTTGRFDATLNPSFFYDASSANRFLTHVAAGSIIDQATARNNIAPNAFVNRVSWTDIGGVARSVTGQGNPGEIWRGSATGPTFDGRLGVDVSAPGTNIFTTYNPRSFFATFRSNVINDGNGFYGAQGAVSAAAPLVTGIVALMLQANPSLDAAQIKQILQQTARSDAQTGATPNPIWGYGKVDAQGAVGRAVMVSCSAAGGYSQCLAANRFRVTVAWSVPSQTTNGTGVAVPLTADTGYFWFFSSNNVELVIKILDARVINGNFWVFYGALSNVQYTIMVSDTQTGTVKYYDNPSGNLASVADTAAFGAAGIGTSMASVAEAPAAPSDEALYARYVDSTLQRLTEGLASQKTASPAAVCFPDGQSLCLAGSRFRVQVAWQVPSEGRSGVGTAVPLTGDTGYFWFFTSNNIELIIKVLDARAINGKFWVFYGALSNVQYTITVTDTATGAVKTYTNPQGTLASVADTSAF